MKTVILVWQEIPESIRIYKFVDIEDGTANKIALCNGLYINGSIMSDEQGKAIDWLSSYTDENKEKIVFNDYPDNELTKVVDITNCDIIVVSGFIL